jgi:RNA polymerase sigma factor (sigma-70 family)
MMPNLLASYVLFPFVGRKNMPDADALTQNAQYLDVADDQSAARELQRVLSLSSPSFYRCALRLLGNRADAEDAVQEALLAAHKHLHQFKGQSQMSTWLTTIVCNCARMQLRKRPRQIHLSLDDQIGEEHKYSVSEKTSGPETEPGRCISKLRTYFPPAKIHGTALTYVATNISATGHERSLDL